MEWIVEIDESKSILEAKWKTEIVRCKDCKWSYHDETMLICANTGVVTDDMFYCADGEREDDEKTNV